MTTLSRAILRRDALALVAASWVVFLWHQSGPGLYDRFGNVRGMDFVQFYAAGWFVSSGRGLTLYDWDTFTRLLPSLVPGLGSVLYVPIYPPQTAIVFAPLGVLSYFPALAVWTLLSVALYAGSIAAVRRSLPALRPFALESWAFALGFPPFLQLIAHGQVGALAMPLLAWAWIEFRKGRPLFVGIALGSLAFKPQFGTLALAALVYAPSARLLAGLAVGAGAQVLLVVAVLGWQPWVDYLQVIGRVTTYVGQFEPKVWAMHSLRGAIQLLVGHSGFSTALWLASVAVVVLLGHRAWRRHPVPAVRFAVIGLVGLLANPHLYVYDLVLLALPLACLASWLIERGAAADTSVRALTYALVWLPLIGPLAAVTHIQLTAPAMAGVLWLLGRPQAGAPERTVA